MEKIYCMDCNASCNVTTKYNQYNSLIPRFLCKKCLKKHNDVIILENNSPLFEYFELVEIFEQIKSDFLNQAIQNIREEFLGKISPDFLESLDHDAYEILKNAKHFGIRKEKLRIAEKYVQQARKKFLQVLNRLLLENEIAQEYREKVLDLQVDILYIRKQHNFNYLDVYTPIPGTSKFYERQLQYSWQINEACADGSNIGYNEDDVNFLFANMPGRILNSDIWN